MNITVQDFFKPVYFKEVFNQDDYKKVELLISFAKALSQVTYQSVYMIDYYRRTFIYVSDNPIFLCGYTAEQVLNYGYLFYMKTVPEEDLKMLLKINEAGFSFFSGLPIEERKHYSISYDFHLRQRDGNLMLVNHKLKPLLLDGFCNPWIALCLVSLSPHSKPGNVLFKNYNLKKIFEYNLNSNTWHEKASVKISKREREVVMLSAQGLTMQEIAASLKININTVKFHKKNIFTKLDVKSMLEAVATSLDMALL